MTMEKTLLRAEDVNARDITLAIRRGWLQIITSHEDVLLGAGALVTVYSYISNWTLLLRHLHQPSHTMASFASYIKSVGVNP